MKSNVCTLEECGSKLDRAFKKYKERIKNKKVRNDVSVAEENLR